jgi:type I restriction-modification system DNA methylase subunit
MNPQTDLLFGELKEELIAPPQKGFTPRDITITDMHVQADVSAAEDVLLRLADYIYGHTALKPMSKTLFFISRCLLLARKGIPITTVEDTIVAYNNLQNSLGKYAPIDDFEFGAVLNEIVGQLEEVRSSISAISRFGRNSDTLGLAFNTLLRGKFEGGEGLGTYLTPEEVATPMVEMGLSALDPSLLLELTNSERSSVHFGDICGGTGRFVYAIYRALLARGASRQTLANAAKLYDQSSLAVGMAKLNFVFDDVLPEFESVSDSIIAEPVSRMRNSFALLATNPPFGTGKYQWNTRLSKSLPKEILQAVGLTSDGAADPAQIFVFRNLDLLMPGGVLVIVLPDGLLQSKEFTESLRVYERCRNTQIQIVGIVSLPAVTFSLGGTVAKTTFVIFRRSKDGQKKTPTYLAHAQHVGFLKRNNRRTADPEGNELLAIAKEFCAHGERIGHFGRDWHDAERLTFAHLRTTIHESPCVSGCNVQLSKIVSPIRESIRVSGGIKHFHISILDVDETGLINIVAATRNRPVTPGLKCQPGDILVSCINPRIWRTTVIPDIVALLWSCSSEFVVLRPKEKDLSWAISLALHHQSVVGAVENLTGGTSSSRQRIEKNLILDLFVPAPEQFQSLVKGHYADRNKLYAIRLREMELYSALHCSAQPVY